MEQLFVGPEGNSVSVYYLKIYTNACIKVYYYLIYIFISPHQHYLNAPWPCLFSSLIILQCINKLCSIISLKYRKYKGKNCITLLENQHLTAVLLKMSHITYVTISLKGRLPVWIKEATVE